MAVEELPLVDVNVETAEHTWPLLLRAVEQADFVALDLELSGLGDRRRHGETSLEDRYKVLREVAETHAVLSLGVACFQWGACDGGHVDCRVEVFNVWLLCQEPYTIDPSSATFLLQHGFDFNKQFAKGLPYSPNTREFRPGDHTPRSLLAYLLHLERPVVLHNGWVDLLFLYHSFYAPLPSSLPSFMADLSEMFLGDVYDTKAIAEYHLKETATFLEYIFRKSQRENAQRQSEGQCHLRLHTAGCPREGYVERVQLALPAPLPLEATLQLNVCRTFARYGFCHTSGCVKSHDVLVVLVQEEHRTELLRIRRKRRRERKNQQRKIAKTDAGGEAKGNERQEPNEDDEREMKEEGMEEEDAKRKEVEHQTSTPELSTTALTDLFHQDLEAARAKLATVSNSQKPSFGHRAGFDAFMTGHTFACYAVGLAKDLSGTSVGCCREPVMAGLRVMRNCLGNRGKPIPLQIAKSHFSKTSAAHRAAQETIRARYGTSAITGSE